MRKLYSLQVELRVIRTLTLEPDSRASQHLLGKLDESFFASEIARAAYKLCLKNLRKNSSLPDWDDMISDPSLDESIRDALGECDLEPLVSQTRTKKAIDRLTEYKKMRLLTRIGKQIESFVNGTDPVNVDEQIAEVQQTLSSARASKSFKIMRIGKNSNVMKHVDSLLKGTSVSYIPTGFKGFDDINRGVPGGSYMLVAAPTGAGKSLMLSQLAENMARSGAKVGIAPLEMVNAEMLQRSVARVADVDMTKLLDPQMKLSRKEHKEIKEKFQNYDERIAKMGGAIEFYEFDEDIGIENLCSSVKPFDLDVLIIDYLGLLDGNSGDDQWRAMMNSARYCHVWGKNNGVVVIAAAQLSDEGVLRYSKGLAEHAKLFWNWTMDPVAKETGIVTIIQRKARQMSDHPFDVQFNFPKMSVKDAEADAIEAASRTRKEQSRASGGRENRKNKWKDDGEMSWGEGDSDDSPIPDPKPGRRAQHDVKKSDSSQRRSGDKRKVPSRTKQMEF